MTRPHEPSRHDPCAADPQRAAAPDRPFVVAQLGQSLDGRIATPTGESRWINQSCALDHVHRLRATVDAVVVGVGTVVADDPLLNVRRVAGRHPVRVVIDPIGRCPPDAKRASSDDGIRRILVRSPRRPLRQCPHGVEVIRIGAYGRTLAPGEIVGALFAPASARCWSKAAPGPSRSSSTPARSTACT